MHDPDRRNLSVLFLCDHLGYPGGVVHGVTTYYQQVLPRLARSSVQLTACFLREHHEAADTLIARGVQPIFLNRSKWDGRAFSDVLSLVRHHDIDLIHAAGLKSAAIARLAQMSVGVRCVLHIHDAQQPSPTIGFLQRRLARWTDAAIGVSHETCEFAAQTLGVDRSKVHCLHNAMELAPFQAVNDNQRAETRRMLDLPQQAPVIGLVGRLTYQKNQLSAIDHLHTIRQSVPNARLLLVGDGPDRAACIEKAARLRLAEVVHCPGQCEDMPAMLSAMDVLTMPSRWEGLPFVSIEAMAAGVPIVAYAVGGLNELMTDRADGVLIPPGDDAAMARRLIEVLTDADFHRQLSRQAKQRARAFDIEQHVQRLLRLYHEVFGPAQVRSTAEPTQAKIL
jgi:glycosyltransferase involved in cell wall biosynthesis